MTAAKTNTQLTQLVAGQRKLPILVRALFWGVGLLAPRVVGHFVSQKMFRPRRLKTPIARIDCPDSAQEIALDFEDSILNVKSWGHERSIVLLVHGWEGHPSDMNAFVLPLRKAGYRVLALELPAHGHSKSTETDVHDVAAAIACVARALGPFYAVIAHSLGAAASTVFLSKHPLSAVKLVLIAPSGSLKREIQRIAGALSLPKRAEKSLEQYVSARYRIPLEECSTAYAAKSAHASMLIFHDRADKVTPVSEAEEIRRAVDHAHLILTDGLGHRRILSDNMVIRRSMNFLSS